MSASTIPPMPLLGNITPERWAKAIRAKPAHVSQQEWNTFVLTAAELDNGRIVPSARILRMIDVGVKAGDDSVANLSKSSLARQAGALQKSFELEASPEGRQQIAAQAPLKFTGSATGTFIGGQVNKNRRFHNVIGIDTLDSDLMNFRKTPVARRTEIGLKSVASKGERHEERLKGV